MGAAQRLRADDEGAFPGEPEAERQARRAEAQRMKSQVYEVRAQAEAAMRRRTAARQQRLAALGVSGSTPSLGGQAEDAQAVQRHVGTALRALAGILAGAGGGAGGAGGNDEPPPLLESDDEDDLPRLIADWDERMQDGVRAARLPPLGQPRAPFLGNLWVARAAGAAQDAAGLLAAAGEQLAAAGQAVAALGRGLRGVRLGGNAAAGEEGLPPELVSDAESDSDDSEHGDGDE